MKLMYLLCIAVFTVSDLASAQGPARIAQGSARIEIDATALEVSRSISRSLFAVQREERAEAEDGSGGELFAELKRLRGLLQTELQLSTALTPLVVGGASAASLPTTRVPDREDRTRLARVEQRERIESVLARVRERRRALDTEHRDFRSPRQQNVARQAIRKALQLEQEIGDALALDPPLRREPLRGLRERLGDFADAQQGTRTATSPATPTLRSIVRHRRAWGDDPSRDKP